MIDTIEFTTFDRDAPQLIDGCRAKLNGRRMVQRSTTIEPERIRCIAAAAMLGLSARTVQGLAAAGRLPGAAMFGRVWTFDRIKLRQFIDAKEAECAKRICIKEPMSGGCAPPSAALNTEKAYEQAISKLLGKPEKCGLNKSKRVRGGVNGN